MATKGNKFIDEPSLQQMAFEELYSRLKKEGSLPLFTRCMVNAGMFCLRLRKLMRRKLKM